MVNTQNIFFTESSSRFKVYMQPLFLEDLLGSFLLPRFGMQYFSPTPIHSTLISNPPPSSNINSFTNSFKLNLFRFLRKRSFFYFTQHFLLTPSARVHLTNAVTSQHGAGCFAEAPQNTLSLTKWATSTLFKAVANN